MANVFKTEKKMVEGLIGRKKGMTQIFLEDGSVCPVTVMELGPCTVIQRKKPDNDGYSAVQLGFEDKLKNVKKPQAGHFAASGTGPKRVLREFRVAEDDEIASGETVSCDIFEAGDFVKVTGTSKGRGFAGTIKRHNFQRGPKSHGSMNVRQPGSIGQSAYPARVFKGMKMSGHMGAKRVSTLGMKVVKVDSGRNLVFVKGSVPGHREAIVVVEKQKYRLRAPGEPE